VLADANAGAPYPPNTMLDEKYRLDQLLEVGGMGAVYLGTHTKLQKQVAIKVLRRELADMPAMIERFQREAVSASRIGHENIVNVSDLGTARDGAPFLVMEYLHGQTLGQRIRQAGAMPIGLASAITREILAAIAAAHSAGIVHRDLKPENVFLVRGSRGESVKILDFGISRVLEAQGEGDGRLTHTGQVMGTPYYMAPEQAAGRTDISGAVDVYATGVILYEMLTGVVPFAAGNYNTIIYKVLSGQYEPLSSVRVGVPGELESIVNRAMSLQPEDRYGSADEFADVLEPFAQGVMLNPATPVPGFRPITGSAPSELPTTHDPRRERPRRRWLGLAIAGVLLAGAATAAVVLASRNQDEDVVAESKPVPAVTAPTPVETAPQPVVEEIAPVVIRIEVDPADAEITVDGAPLAGAELQAPRSDREVEIAVSRDGYKSKTRRVALGENRTVEVILEKEPGVSKKRPRDRKKTQAPGEGKRIIEDSPYE
jgi:serine/threonine protein kinase